MMIRIYATVTFTDSMPLKWTFHGKMKSHQFEFLLMFVGWDVSFSTRSSERCLAVNNWKPLVAKCWSRKNPPVKALYVRSTRAHVEWQIIKSCKVEQFPSLAAGSYATPIRCLNGSEPYTYSIAHSRASCTINNKKAVNMSVKVQHENDLSWMQSSRFNYASEPVDCFCWDGYERCMSRSRPRRWKHMEVCCWC